MWTDNTRKAKIKGDQIEVFKILNGYENIDSNIFFEIKESKITRGHNYTLVKKQSRLDVRQYSFSQRTINVWDTLVMLTPRCAEGREFDPRPGQYSRMSFSSDQATGTVFPHLNMPFLPNSKFI